MICQQHQYELEDFQLKRLMASDAVKLTREKIIHLNSYERACTTVICSYGTAWKVWWVEPT